MLKRILFVFTLLSFVFIQCSDSITDPKEIRELTEIEKKVVSSSEEFGLKLFNQVNTFEGEKNIFISPLSISMALGMALNGANGSTYEAMQSTLEFNSLTNQEINEAYNSLIELLTQIDSEVIFQIANSIWYKNTMQFESEFINVNKKYFDAEVAGLDFNDPNSVDIINNWVNGNTNGKITKILDAIPEAAVMYLINAIYFKGTWQYEFDKDETRDDSFNLPNGEDISCKMMAQTNENFSYFENNQFQAIDLPYGDGYFSITIILPNNNLSVNEIINQLDLQNWNSWLSNFEKQTGTLQLPKFELEYDYTLNDVLKALGMEIAFVPEMADFTRLYKPGGIFISNVKHKTYVKLDEEGTEAAAVTAVEFGATSVGPGGFFMRVNRPFIIAIREHNSGSILFMGKIVEPVWSE